MNTMYKQYFQNVFFNLKMPCLILASNCLNNNSFFRSCKFGCFVLSYFRSYCFLLFLTDNITDSGKDYLKNACFSQCSDIEIYM